MKVIFLGTPQFAVPVLQAILESSHKVILVVTQPDRANRRGNKIVYSPLKEKALQEQLPIAQYPKISSNVGDIAKLKPDIIVTAGYGQLLSQELIDTPKYGIINVHGSLLPKYRGASPVQSALLNGEKIIGVTIMNTQLALDAGEVILQQSLELNGDENASECLGQLAIIGGGLTVRALDLIEQGKAEYIEQDISKVTYSKLLKKEEGKLDFSDTAENLKNRVRAFTPNPSAYILTKIGRLKVIKSQSMADNSTAKCGEIISVKDGLVIKCGKDALALLEVQPENSKVMDIADFLRGKGSVFALGENIANAK